MSHGDFEINDYTETAYDEMTRWAHGFLMDVAEDMVDLSKREPPVGSPVSEPHGGHNRDSTRMDPAVPPDDALEVEVATESGYGGYLELGTKYMEARPYLSTAFDDAVANAERAYS